MCIGDGPFATGPKVAIHADLAPLNTCTAHPAGPKVAIHADLAPLVYCAAHYAGPKVAIHADLAPRAQIFMNKM